jgi:hypothetical protein
MNYKRMSLITFYLSWYKIGRGMWEAMQLKKLSMKMKCEF